MPQRELVVLAVLRRVGQGHGLAAHHGDEVEEHRALVGAELGVGEEGPPPPPPPPPGGVEAGSVSTAEEMYDSRMLAPREVAAVMAALVESSRVAGAKSCCAIVVLSAGAPWRSGGREAAEAAAAARGWVPCPRGDDGGGLGIGLPERDQVGLRGDDGVVGGGGDGQRKARALGVEELDEGRAAIGFFAVKETVMRIRSLLTPTSEPSGKSSSSGMRVESMGSFGSICRLS